MKCSWGVCSQLGVLESHQKAPAKRVLRVVQRDLECRVEGGGGRGGRGGMGGQDYSSPVLGDGKIFYVSRSGELHVLRPAEKLDQISAGRITTEPEDFSASPAISNGRLLIRSNRHLYCFTTKK